MDQQLLPASNDSLIGREDDLQFLLEKIRAFNPGDSNLLIIQGVPGVGKTSLIQQLLLELKSPRTFHIYGKFRDLVEKTPYLAIKQALKDWTNQILTLSEAEYENLKQVSLQALQLNAGVLVDVFEELRPFFGQKYIKREEVSPTEVHQIQARFYYFFSKFLKSIQAAGYQLILFIDDLQWSDNATIVLLKHLLQSNQSSLLVIAASRNYNDEITNQLIQGVENRAYSYSLKPLPRKYLQDFIPGEWAIDAEIKTTLLKYLQRQSEGNPFKLRQLIRMIKADWVIPHHGEFEPHFLEILSRLPLEKDTENLMKKQLDALTIEQKEVLGLATLIGYYFKPELLQRLYEKELDPVLNQLETLDLLVINGNSSIFRHDFIFQAATQLIPPHRRKTLHRKLATIILADLPNYYLPDYFTAINHLNSSLESKNNDQVILYNIQAGNLAINNSAILRAGKYFHQAHELLKFQRTENLIVRDPKLAEALAETNLNVTKLKFIILFAEAQIAFLQKKYQECINQLIEVLNLPIGRQQKVKAVNLKLMSCSAIMHLPNTRSILEDGIASLTSVLADFDIRFPESDQEFISQVSDFCHQIVILESSWPKQDAPVNNDVELLELQKLIINSLTFLYYMDVKKNLFLSLNTLFIILKTGLTPISPVFFSISFLLGVVDAKYTDAGFRLGKRAIKLVEEPPYDNCYHIVHYIATLNFFAWENHYHVCIDRLQKSVQKAYELGDHQYVSFCFNIILLLHNYSGKNLRQQKSLSDRLQKENSHTFFISSSNYTFIQFLLSEKPGFDKGDFCYPDELMHESNYNLSSRYHLNLNLTILNFLAGKYKEAESSGAICENLRNVYRGFQIELEHFFYYSLVVLELAYQKQIPLEKALEIVNPKLQEFRRLAVFGSGNYLHKLYLVEAGIEKNKNSFEKATLLYDMAIAEAVKQEFIHLAAIGSELAASYYRDKNRLKISEVYLSQAFQYYKQWGADAKLEQLKKIYPHLYSEREFDHTNVSQGTDQFLKDLLTINQNYLQTNLANLGSRLLQKLIKYSDAIRGMIFISELKNWKVLAVSHKNLKHLLNRELQDCRDFLPEKVINYAIHQGVFLALRDTRENALFAGDIYLQKNNAGNIYFIPVLNQSEKLAIIYLEGTNTTDENLFRLIAEQATVILANAINYEKLKQLNVELKTQEQIRIATAIASQEKERKRVAEELHDSIGQMLALIRLNFSELENGFEDKGKASLFYNTTQLLDDSCQEVRTISHNLMPPDLNLPLTQVLEKLIRKNIAQLPFTYQYNTFDLEGEFPEALKFTIYRILQEIIHNVIKHAEASHLNITITRIDDEINLMVEDNGKGFDKKIALMGLGLKNINSRVKLLNGFFDVDSSLNRGTIYTITIPIGGHGKN